MIDDVIIDRPIVASDRRVIIGASNHHDRVNGQMHQ